MIVRYEPWGAWVKLEKQPALVALDRDGVRALGLRHEWNDDAPPRESFPLEVHVAVTSRCAAGCEGCYLDARPDGIEPPRAEIERTFDALAAAGVFTVAFGGGEPSLREDLGELADAARARGLTPVVTTSGLGLGPSKIAKLARFAQVNVSYDGPSDAYAAVRGFDGSAAAESAIASLAAAGVAVGVNVVLTRETFDRVPETLARARALGASEAQLLRYKPAGRAVTLDYLAKRLSPSQTDGLSALLRAVSSTMRVRIDCALVPFLSADPEIAAHPERLARWGVLGCEAGAALAATRVDGRVSPCSFAAPTELHVSGLSRGWQDEAGLLPFRAHAAAPPEPCASCTLRSVCRGGCKIVSKHLSGGIGPRSRVPAGARIGIGALLSARLALAVASGCTSAALLYAILRLVQALVMPEPDPALVMWSEHSGFFWRSWTAAYAGGMIALLTWLLAGRASERTAHTAHTARFVARAVFPVAAALALQAALVP